MAIEVPSPESFLGRTLNLVKTIADLEDRLARLKSTIEKLTTRLMNMDIMVDPVIEEGGFVLDVVGMRASINPAYSQMLHTRERVQEDFEEVMNIVCIVCVLSLLLQTTYQVSQVERAWWQLMDEKRRHRAA